MQRKLFFGLAVFFIAMLAFVPVNVMAQMRDRGDSAQMADRGEMMRDQALNEDYDFSVPAQAGRQDTQQNQEPARSGSMDQNVTRTPEQTRSTDRAAAGSTSNQARDRDQASRSAQQDQTTHGTVTGVDRPDGCLRIRAEATSSSDIIGCAKMGEKLQLSGRFSSDGRWAKLANEGWVFSNQIDAPNKPQVRTQARRSTSRTYDFESSDMDSSLWQEPAGTSYYGSDYYTPYYGYGPSIGFGWGGGRGWRGGGHHGRHGGGGGFHGGFHGGGGHRR